MSRFVWIPCIGWGRFPETWTDDEVADFAHMEMFNALLKEMFGMPGWGVDIALPEAPLSPAAIVVH